jgi:ribosomal protein RSM22 (predicted rRNA methylase)
VPCISDSWFVTCILSASAMHGRCQIEENMMCGGNGGDMIIICIEGLKLGNRAIMDMRKIVVRSQKKII